MHNLVAAMQAKQTLYYTGRPSSASPAVGYYSVHIEEQKALISQAITIGAGMKQYNQTIEQMT
jgi:2-oxoglutarate dehydrogenase E1 component